MIITENGRLVARDTIAEDGQIYDDYRIDYWQQHLVAINKAISFGVDVFGFLP